MNMFTLSLKKPLIKNYAVLLFTVALAVAVLLYPNSAFSFTEGLKLWLTCVLPAVFPFMILSAAISANPAAATLAFKLSPLSEKIFKINGNGAYAFFLSVVSGYPVGAKVVSELYEKGLLSPAETLRASLICSTASPVFLISGIGAAAFNSVKFGALLFLTQIVSAVIVGIVLSFIGDKNIIRPSKNTFNTGNFSIFRSVEKSAMGIITVGAIIALIYLFTDMLFDFGVLKPFISAVNSVVGDYKISEGIIFAVFECTKGIKRISESGISVLSLPLCAAACGFGGLSVIVQSLAFFKTTKIKAAAFVFGKLFASAVNFFVGLVFSLLFFA